MKLGLQQLDLACAFQINLSGLSQGIAAGRGEKKADPGFFLQIFQVAAQHGL